MLLYVFILLILLLCLSWWLFSKTPKRPPGPRNLPLVGSMFSLGPQPHLTFHEWSKTYGPIVYTKLGVYPTLIISDPKLIREAYSQPVFNGRPTMKVIDKMFGEHGILLAEGERCKELRRFLVRNLRDLGFRKQSVESLVFDEIAEILDWIKRNEGKPLSINRRFSLAVLNSLWRVLAGFGYKRYSHDDPKLNMMHDKANETMSELTTSGALMFLPQLETLFPKWFSVTAVEAAMKPLRNLFLTSVAEHDDSPPDANSPRDFIDAYSNEILAKTNAKLENPKEFDQSAVADLIGDVFFAGSASTIATMEWSILYLLKFPHIQKKLQKELDTVIGRSRLPSLSDRNMTPYTEAFMMEVMRWGSVAPNGLFHNTTENTTFHGYYIEKNTLVVGNAYSIHYDPSVWGDPENFRPERFIDEDGITVKRNHEGMLGFSAGKRQCPGEAFGRDQFYLYLTTIAQKYTISPDPADPNPTLDSEIGFVLEPKKFTLLFHERL